VTDPQTPYEEIDFFRAAPAETPSADPGPEDPGLIIYTSGTTGQPKGTILTQKNLIHDAEPIISIWEITDSDVLCHALPLFHFHGLCFGLHTALTAGSHVLLLRELPRNTMGKVLKKEVKKFFKKWLIARSCQSFLQTINLRWYAV
jgi:malonyl-CoA/methylmalonyl-CoA synthetase